MRFQRIRLLCYNSLDTNQLSLYVLASGDGDSDGQAAGSNIGQPARAAEREWIFMGLTRGDGGVRAPELVFSSVEIPELRAAGRFGIGLNPGGSTGRGRGWCRFIPSPAGALEGATSSGRNGGRPGRGSSSKPAERFSKNLLRHLLTSWRGTERLAAISSLGRP